MILPGWPGSYVDEGCYGVGRSGAASELTATEATTTDAQTASAAAAPRRQRDLEIMPPLPRARPAAPLACTPTPMCGPSRTASAAAGGCADGSS